MVNLRYLEDMREEERDRKQITLKRETYYKLLRMKGELECSTWEKLVDRIEKELRERKKRYSASY